MATDPMEGTDETAYEAAWRAYKAAPRAVANGPSRSAVRAAVDAALAASQPVLMFPDDVRLARVIADNIEQGKLDHPGFYRNSQLAEVLRRVLSAALVVQDADLVSAVKIAYGLLWMTNDDPASSMPGTVPPHVSLNRVREVLRDTITHEQRREGIAAARALIDSRVGMTDAP